jgi:hypothetical protein
MTSAPVQSWAPTMENLHEQQAVHCNENLIYVFPDKELRGLSPDFHLQVFFGIVSLQFTDNQNPLTTPNSQEPTTTADSDTRQFTVSTRQPIPRQPTTNNYNRQILYYRKLKPTTDRQQPTNDNKIC